MLVSNHSYGIVVDSDTPAWYFGCHNVGNNKLEVQMMVLVGMIF